MTRSHVRSRKCKNFSERLQSSFSSNEFTPELAGDVVSHSNGYELHLDLEFTFHIGNDFGNGYNVLKQVLFTDNDDATFVSSVPDERGMTSVRGRIKPVGTEGRVTDILKIHGYSINEATDKELPVLYAAGFVPVLDLYNEVEDTITRNKNVGPPHHIFNNCNTDAVMTVRVIPPQDRAAFQRAHTELKAFIAAHAVRSVLHDSDWMNNAIQEQAKFTQGAIKKKFDIPTDPASANFECNIMPLPMQSQYLRMTSMRKAYGSMKNERCELPVLINNVLGAMQAAGMTAEDVASLKDRDAAQLYASVVTVGALDNKAQPYTPDWVPVGLVEVATPTGKRQIVSWAVGENTRPPHRYPEKPAGVIRADDCEGFMLLMLDVFKATEYHGTLFASGKHTPAGTLKSKWNKLFSNFETHEIQAACDFISLAAKQIQANKWVFHNPLGGASSASAGDAPVEETDTADFEANEGGHSWAMLLYYDKAPKPNEEAQADACFLLEGTAMVHQLDPTKGRTIPFIVKTGDPKCKDKLVERGFEYVKTVQEDSQTWNYVQRKVGVDEIINMTEAENFMRPINPHQFRGEIAFMPSNKAFRRNMPGFYRRFYYTGDNIVSEIEGSDSVFGQYFSSFQAEKQKVRFTKVSSKPYEGKEAEAIEEFITARMKEVFPPVIPEEQRMAKYLEAWMPTTRAALPAQERLIATDVHLGNKKTQVVYVQDKYECITVADAFSSQKDAKEVMRKMQSMVDSVNTNFQEQGLGHQLTTWHFQNCVVRTLYLHRGDLLKVHVASIT